MPGPAAAGPVETEFEDPGRVGLCAAVAGGADAGGCGGGRDRAGDEGGSEGVGEEGEGLDEVVCGGEEGGGEVGRMEVVLGGMVCGVGDGAGCGFRAVEHGGRTDAV